MRASTAVTSASVNPSSAMSRSRYRVMGSFSVPQVSISPAGADVTETDAILLAHLERQRHAGHDRHHVAQRRYLADEPACEIAKVDVQLTAARRRIALGHVLPQHFERRRAFHEHRAEIAD